MKRTALLVLLVFASSASAQDAITFPVVSPLPNPPTAATKLMANAIYVVHSDKPFILEPGVLGLVSVTMETGPLRIRSVFADSLGKIETRTIPGKHIAIVEATGTGRVDLLVFQEVGKAVIRKTIDVDNGQEPRPPPPDPKPPEPKPPSPAPIPVAGLRVLFVIEENEPDKLTAGQRATLYGKPMRDWLNGKCVVGADGKTKEWRIWDQNVNTQSVPKHWQDVMARKRDSVPWLVISNFPHGGFEGPMPATEAETKALIQKYME